MRRNIALLVLAGSLAACGGDPQMTKTPSPPPPVQNADISGSWEFVKATHYTEDTLDPCAGCFTTGQEELVETVITQQNGTWQGNQTMPITVAFFSATPNDWNQTAEWVGGICNGNPGNSSMNGTVVGKAITFTVDENGLSFTGTGTVNADGTMSGSYTTNTSPASSFCDDPGGTFTAHKTDPMNGTLAEQHICIRQRPYVHCHLQSRTCGLKRSAIVRYGWVGHRGRFFYFQWNGGW